MKLKYAIFVGAVGIISGCASPMITQVKHTYIPTGQEAISLTDNPCIEQAIEKAKTKLNLTRPRVVDSYVSVNMDAQKRGMVYECHVDIELPEES